MGGKGGLFRTIFSANFHSVQAVIKITNYYTNKY